MAMATALRDNKINEGGDGVANDMCLCCTTRNLYMYSPHTVREYAVQNRTKRVASRVYGKTAMRDGGSGRAGDQRGAAPQSQNSTVCCDRDNWRRNERSR